MASDPHITRLLWFLFTGSRGGLNRLRIISAIKEKPLNTNQLANKLNLDYKAIKHHIEVLQKNNLISAVGERYAVAFFISPLLDAHLEDLEEIEKKIGQK